MKELNKENWKAWLRAQPGMDSAVKVLIGIVLVFLLIGIIAAAFRFLWSAFVLIGLIALALLALGKLRQQGVKVPIRFADYRNRKSRPERAEARRKRSV
jgi:hypothetical protein